jgi:choline/carnitine/betaine transport
VNRQLPTEEQGRVDRVVVGLGIAGVLAVVAWGTFAPDSLAGFAKDGLHWVITNFGWLFVIAADAFLVLAVVIALRRYGRIRLGRDDEQPEFTTLAWIAMMFSAGMGIGLVFYATYEPIRHFADPPPGSSAAALSGAAADQAMQFTYFHWTLHPWAIYAIAGLAIAYATFRKGRGNRISAVFYPLLGDRIDGAAGRAIDLLAIFATVFGSATSLGLGALQVGAGLNRVAGVPDTRWLELVIIAALTAAFVVSAFSGVHKGIKWLSSTNVLIALALMAFVFVVGPTVYVLDLLPASIGSYLAQLVTLSTRTAAFGDPAWLGNWTIFYWAWWISWTPFVGTFIARISRGRTVRQFIVGVLLVPSGASAVWFAVLGGTAIRTQMRGRADLVADAVPGQEQQVLFTMLDALPLAGISMVVAMVLVAIYFVTGADSASIVLGTLSSRGAIRPRRRLVVTWGILIGAVAAVLLLAGGLKALQQATVLVALPFVVVMLALAVSLVRELATDPAGQPPAHPPQHGLRDAVQTITFQEDGQRLREARNRRSRSTSTGSSTSAAGSSSSRLSS